ncbi:MAG: nitrogen fixation protein NifB [Candidatus Methanomethylophilaceae archaeon]|nr:nitrogen fixation protein NifB [Candidatus Methanomethylophilaceae archaeon]MDI3541755.1 nitrogen fixation protein NifB [Candidatus Methanomethylophilaceae archaeon]
MNDESISRLKEALSRHPCYTEEAHKHFARMHLPVAPRCNIQCKYCNRKYDCCNETRPGVTSEILSPQEALERVRAVKERIPELSVVAIAGPGDPMANEETFETMQLVKEEFPDLTLCLSTNGLMLADNLERIEELGISFITVTINAVDPDVGKEIYEFVLHDGKRLEGREAAELLLQKQIAGIKGAVERGMLVKANIVLIPDINKEHIPEMVTKLKDLGVYIVNILPLIPVEGTAFSDQRAPTSKERKELQDLLDGEIKMMRHCKQCRADAIGLLGEDRQMEFQATACGATCGPVEPMAIVEPCESHTVAISTIDGVTIDGGLGNSRMFRIYELQNGKFTETGRTEVNIDMDAPLVGETHRRRLQAVADELTGHYAVIVTGAGDLARKIMSSRGVKVITAGGFVEDALNNIKKELSGNG